ncbi:2S proteasome subunit alpha 5 [Nematocida displodere]|uniref:2S proteasome subunit alpha 5 n=1 Tax=Nematocida displodere TaxID=1805483 RepID=A0A177EJB2_9MICR|nr:2S proteasome subunit alpha 5 [Nematocida displodere]
MKKERNVNAYSSDGRIYQLEYAMKAASLGTTTIGLKVSDGVVVVSEKKIVTPLQVPDSVKKHHRVFDHCGFAFSGLSGDARTIIRKARDFSVNHSFNFMENIPIEGIAKSLAAIALNFGEKDDAMKIFSRPFGISALLCGYDSQPRLFSLDPSGTYIEHHAKSIGSAAEAVTSALETEYNASLCLKETLPQALSLLKGVMKDPLTSSNCEVMVCTEAGVEFLTPQAIEDILHQ